MTTRPSLLPLAGLCCLAIAMLLCGGAAHAAQPPGAFATLPDVLDRVKLAVGAVGISRMLWAPDRRGTPPCGCADCFWPPSSWRARR